MQLITVLESVLRDMALKAVREKWKGRVDGSRSTSLGKALRNPLECARLFCRNFSIVFWSPYPAGSLPCGSY